MNWKKNVKVYWTELISASLHNRVKCSLKLNRITKPIKNGANIEVVCYIGCLLITEYIVSCAKKSYYLPNPTTPFHWLLLTPPLILLFLKKKLIFNSLVHSLQVKIGDININFWYYHFYFRKKN